MSKQKTKNELLDHNNQAISILHNYLDKLVNSDDEKLQGKADKLSYWICDWAKFLNFETDFSPQSLRRYKRGEIIKVHLGFNIGSEEGGLHYAVVVEKNNAKSSPVATIVPLTSVKPTTDINKLKNGNIFLGNELFTILNAKISSASKQISENLTLLTDILKQMRNDASHVSIEDIENKVQDCKFELETLKRMRSEVQKMKIGSIALVNQITTISKIRIYDPKTDHDVLSNIKLSNEKLDMLDTEIQKMFTNF